MKYLQVILAVLTFLLMVYSCLQGEYMQSGFQLMMGAAIILLIQRKRDEIKFKQNQSEHD